MKRNKLKLIDLFSGAGGFTSGLLSHFGDRLQVVWANDFNRAAVDTYNANFGNHGTHEDLNEYLSDPENEIPQADIVIGGPPCQGFSLLNKNRINDPRKQLWIPFMEVVDRSGASVFVMENVRQLFNSPEHVRIKERAEILGFKTTAAVLCAADYGVPQVRHRAFIIGSKISDPNLHFPPSPSHYNPRLNGKSKAPRNGIRLLEYTTVRNAIFDLDKTVRIEIREISPPMDLHFGRNPTELSKKRYRTIPEEGMNRFDLQRLAPEITSKCWIRKKSGGTDLFGRLWWDRPAVTIRTEFFKPEKGRYLHPEQHRPITHREAARFQTFPDHFVFKGSKIEIARQIGNAVPPLLARQLAKCVDALEYAG